MLLPIRSKNPPEAFPFATISLIVANVAIYAFTSNGLAVHPSAVRSLALFGADFTPVRIATAMFLHASPLHLIGNMWFLYLFGFAVEGRLKSLKFLAMYFASGVAGDVLFQVLVGVHNPNMPAFGASGAIMGLLGASLFMFPFAEVTFLYLGYTVRTFDWPMWGVGAYFLGFELLWAFLGVQDGVGHLAHLGGALGGLVVCAAFRPNRDSEFASQAKATLADTKDTRCLSAPELEELARLNPTSHSVAVAWMRECLRESRPIKEPCMRGFLAALKSMPPGGDESATAADCLARLAATPDAVPCNVLFEMAQRMEREYRPRPALSLYEAVLRDSKDEADLQAATFRVGLLCESSMNNPAAAAQRYREVIQKWPMSPMAAQAELRLMAVTPRLAQSPAQGGDPGPSRHLGS